jgi:DNA-directed RNA polymerase specialized sigma24 family protein
LNDLNDLNDLNGLTELLTKAAAGDRQAWEEVYCRTEPELRKLAKYWIKHKCANGIVQTTEVILEALKVLMGIQSPDWPHRHAFFKFASNNILWALIRLLKSHWEHDELTVDVPAAERSLAVETLQTLKDALDDLSRELSEQHRRVVELRHLCGLTLVEVTKMLPISIYQAFRMDHIALNYLHEKLAPSFSENA